MPNFNPEPVEGSKLGPYQLNTIITGDARQLSPAIPDHSIDLIFTDPPYKRQSLHLYTWLAEEAARLLKPDAFLLAYAGAYWKDEIMHRLRSHLSFFWDYIIFHAHGPSSLIWQRRIVSRYVSILAYHLPNYRPLPRCKTLGVWTAAFKDKRFHLWGQDEHTAQYFVDCFSSPDAIVADFFTGAGTIPAVAQRLHRNFLAFEIDPSTADVARSRLAGTIPLPQAYTLPLPLEVTTDAEF